MTGVGIVDLVIGAVLGVGSAAALAAVIFGGICVPLTLLKFRSTKNSLTIKNLDERVGQRATYLPASAPRGPVDQLRGSTTG